MNALNRRTDGPTDGRTELSLDRVCIPHSAVKTNSGEWWLVNRTLVKPTYPISGLWPTHRCVMHRFLTGKDHCAAISTNGELRHTKCPCGQRQTMNHIFGVEATDQTCWCWPSRTTFCWWRL